MGFARGSGTSLAHARSQAANKNRTMDSDFIERPWLVSRLAGYCCLEDKAGLNREAEE
jgi:hypothetical protein